MMHGASLPAPLYYAAFGRLWALYALQCPLTGCISTRETLNPRSHCRRLLPRAPAHLPHIVSTCIIALAQAGDLPIDLAKQRLAKIEANPPKPGADETAFLEDKRKVRS